MWEHFTFHGDSNWCNRTENNILLTNQSLNTAENKSQYSLTITIIWNVTQSITKDCKNDYDIDVHKRYSTLHIDTN